MVSNPLDRILQAMIGFSRVMRHQMLTMAKEGRMMNFHQVHALSLIEDHQGMTMKELAVALQITSPSATSLVNRLVRQRWVKRQRDAGNRRVVRLRLTPEGTKMLHRMYEKRAEMMRNVFRLLSVKEQKQLASIVEKLRDTVHSSHSPLPRA